MLSTVVFLLCACSLVAFFFVTRRKNAGQTPAAIGPVGSLVKIKHGAFWLGEGLDLNEKVGLLVESAVRTKLGAGQQVVVEAFALNMPVQEYPSQAHAMLSSGGDHFVQVSFGDRLAWIEASASAIEVL